jgi:hypothetical protein
MRLSFAPAAGLRLEIACDIDKKKSELYFYFLVKKFLTKKQKRACPQATKISSRTSSPIEIVLSGIFFVSAR